MSYTLIICGNKEGKIYMDNKGLISSVLPVVPSVPSCVEGKYLPRFLPPTPEHRAHLYTTVNQSLEIPVSAEASQST